METVTARTGAAPASEQLAWDDDQVAVISRGPAASGVVVGAPGSGKTAVIVARAAALVAGGLDPDAVLVLTPTRQTATALRDRLSLAMGRARSGPPARSLASLAFEIVRAYDVQQGQPAPRLLTGADDDQIVHELLRGDEADEAEGLPSRWPEGFGAAVRSSRAFRSEVRAFVAECTALGITAGDLVELADRCEVPVWRALAGFIAEYDDVRASLRAAHRDAAGLVDEAVALVRRLDHADPAFAAVRRLRAVLVDDAQELTLGGVALLEALHDRGVAVTAFGDPDIGSGVFRGARPEHFARLADALGGASVLRTVHRGTPAQEDVVRTVTQRIGAAGIVAHRAAPRMTGADDSVRVLLARSAVEEHDAIARLLRERHLRDGVPWHRCAVIAHDSRQVATLETELSAREVPARAPGLVEPLGRRGCVRNLVGVIGAAADDAVADPAETLLAAGLDPVDLRRLRAALRQAEIAAGGTRSARELLASGLRRPTELVLLGTREALRAAKVAETLALLRTQLDEGASAHQLVWTAWSRSGFQRVWVQTAAGNGPLAEQAGRDLDAIVALVQAAKRFGERAEDGGVADPMVFVRGILDSDVAEDLFTVPSSRERVQVLTPTAALGLEFDTVVIAGLQDGVWPNTRLRGTLLQGWRLSEARLPDAVPSSSLDRRREVLHDELRLFARALSRAERALVVTAVDDDAHAPSPFLEILPDAVPAPVVHPLSLRGLVAAHRRMLSSPGSSAAAREHAAAQLALLADARVAGAHPDSWYGIVEPSSTAALRDPRAESVRVSPSRVEALERCELDWVIGDLGGDPGTVTAGLGTLVHHALETAGPDAESLWAAVESRWSELEFEAPWRERAERARARDLVRRLAAYLRQFEAAGGRLLGAESRFEVPLPFAGDPGAQPIILSGTIDRVEATPDDRVVIVDLKTGKSVPHTDAKVADHPQLAAYQVAVAAGAVPDAGGREGAGARLLVLQPGTRHDFTTPTQHPLDAGARAAFLGRLQTAAAVMSGATFRAPYEEHCRDDFGHGLCRIHTVPPVSAS
ncbi:ATP-dependent helicase [Microbacterium caowuchunii]|uniref:DNA 3'-5' helicase n=1 Tax=Microbacterium caowuchunii TaxID=2614638 RepID=A0A5N0TI53_9MICO|nr:ATP-dependent DNA helicase [Microbacterium caowuchunii]KAA9134795.1 ATP-dependent helicase [Microbacterium caowuchunii]